VSPRSYRPDDDETGRWPLFLFVASVVFHVAIFYTLHEMDEPERERKLILYEVAVEEPKPEPEPEPEPEEPPPEPEPEPEPEEPPPELEPPPKKQLKQPKQPKQPPPADDLPPPPKIRLPASQLVPSGSGSPVAVNPGTTTSPGRIQGSDDGKPRGKPKGTGEGTGGTGTAPSGPKWAPKSDIYIKSLPRPKKQPPKLQCPASRDKGVYGTVVLSIDVRRDGTIRGVKVVRGIGSGCDEVAKKALKKMTLSPAVGTDGQIADYSGLRYEYVFDPPN
jgi:TonB family protein